MMNTCRVFSAHMVEKDGESLKALWIALRRLYRKALAPKANAANIPMAIRALLLQRQQQLQQQQVWQIKLTRNKVWLTEFLSHQMFKGI